MARYGINEVDWHATALSYEREQLLLKAALEEVSRLKELLQECVEPLMCLGDEELARRIRKEVE